MRKNVFGKKLSRDTHERNALFKGLMNALILHEKIKTTQEKAKAIKGGLEKLITKSRSSSLQARRELISKLGQENTAAKMVEVIGPKFKDRPGGYLRMIKLGPRRGDNAQMVQLEFVEDLRPEVKESAQTVQTKVSPKIKVRRVSRASSIKKKPASQKKSRPSPEEKNA